MACPGGWAGRNLSKWIMHLEIDPLGPQVLAQPLTRAVLKDLCADPTVPDRDCLWAILAWGAMKLDAAKRLAPNEKVWAKVVGRLRMGDLDRTSSYKICSDAMSGLPAGGIGPAYFTKLIYFANPRHDGYIMDQWTSRSINFLVEGAPTIRMRTKDHVDPRNTPSVYEQFCSIVEELSTHLLRRTPEETEQCLFSQGGREKGKWRSYLLKHGG